MSYTEKINDYFSRNADTILAQLAELIAIPSVRTEAAPDAPFGPACREALDWALHTAGEMGFSTRDVDGYAGHVDLNDKEPALGILAHLDVVEAGEGWTMPPYECTEKDGRIYGRGVMDDKGPALIALHAMAAAREACPELSKGARLVWGCAEETGSECLAYYRSRVAFPPALFTPDAAFPVCNIEKGRYAPTFGADWTEETALPRVTCLLGGKTTNIVPGRAEATVEGLAAEQVLPLAAQVTEQTGVLFKLEAQDGALHIGAEGLGSHAADPEKGKNALTALIRLLDSLPLADSACRRAIGRMARMFPYGDDYGQALGVARNDELSGPLTLVFSVLDLGLTGFTARFDSRLSISCTEENTCSELRTRLAEAGMPVRADDVMTPPHHTPADTELVKTLNRVYERVTGLAGGCVAMGGGTYVHGIPGGVAFGCGLPDRDYRFHGADEYAVVEELLNCGRMFAQVIVELCR